MRYLKVIVSAVMIAAGVLFAQDEQPPPPHEWDNYKSGEILTIGVRMTLAQELARGNYLDEAIEVYTNIIDEYPDDVDAILGRAFVLSWSKIYTSSISDFRKVIALSPKYIDAWRGLASVLTWVERPAQAVEAYDQLLALQPENGSDYLARARQKILLEDYAGARTDLESGERYGEPPIAIRSIKAQFPDEERPVQWSVRVDYSEEQLSNNLANWRRRAVAIQKKFPMGTASVGMEVISRFDRDDRALVLDGYQDLWPNAYSNVRFSAGLNQTLLPNYDLHIEIYQGIRAIWEFSLSYRRMVFPAVNVNILGISGTNYLGKWYLRANMLIIPSINSVDTFMGAMIRYYYGDRDYFGIFTGMGRNLDAARIGDETITERVLVLSEQHYFNDHFGISFGANMNISRNYNRRGITLSVITSW